jgi:hypothetical protein
MGKHKDGHSYMNSVGLIRKIDDIPELKEMLIDISESKGANSYGPSSCYTSC